MVQNIKKKAKAPQAEDKLKLRSQSVIPRSRKITFEWLSKIKVTNKDLARCKESLQFVVYGMLFMLFTLLLVLSMMMLLLHAFCVLPRHASQVVESLSSLAEGGPALLSLARPYNCPREVSHNNQEFSSQ